MKSVVAVDSNSDLPERRVPSPKVTDDTSKNKMSLQTLKKKKTKKNENIKINNHDKNEIEADLFKVIGNPKKMTEEPQKATGKKKKKCSDISIDSFSVSDSGSYRSEYRESMGSMGSMGSKSGISEISSDYMYREEFAKKKRKEEIMQEKIEMLTRISKMSKQGFTATRNWSLKDDIDEIRFECYRMTRENNSKKAVKNMQHMLITVATILEFANNVVNPFNLRLQGFSKNMMLTVSDYDDSLEELHHKWSGRTAVGPEMTVLFTFVTSAIFHHAGNVMNNSDSKGEKEKTEKTEKTAKPKMDLSSMMGLFSTMMPVSRNQTDVKNNSNGENSGTESLPKKRKSMKGPSGGVGLPFSNLVPSMTID